jgi:hypothetical protein
MGRSCAEVRGSYTVLRKAYNDLKVNFDRLLDKYCKLEARVKPFLDAIKYAPERVREFIWGVLNLQKQEQEQQRQQKKQKSRDRGGR